MNTLFKILNFFNFQQSSQESIQQKRTEVLAPLLEKAQNAINEVAEENNYTYIFDISLGSIVYGKESKDIMPLVKTKFGNILNIIAQKEIIPELIQQKCNSEEIYKITKEFINNQLLREKLVVEYTKILEKIYKSNSERPNTA